VFVGHYPNLINI